MVVESVSVVEVWKVRVSLDVEVVLSVEVTVGFVVVLEVEVLVEVYLVEVVNPPSKVSTLEVRSVVPHLHPIVKTAPAESVLQV